MTRISEAVVLFLLNAVWQATLVALLVSVGDRVLRKAAAHYRHVMWVAALVACVALTLVSLRVMSPATASLPPTPSVDLDQDSSREAAVTKTPLERAPAGRPVSRRTTLPQIMMPRVGLSKTLALAIGAFYGVLLLYRVGLLLKAWGRTRTLLRSARTVELSTPVVQALAVCQRGFGLRSLLVLSSATVTVPATAGARRPLLILPEYLLREGDVHLLTSALGHEAAHIARRDYLLNLVYEFVSLPLWFHPAMWLVLRRIRQTRELCCDEMVTERLLEPRIYAQSLVQLAGAALPFGRPAATIMVGIADADILEERIMRILKYSPTRRRRRSALLLVESLLFVVPCIAAAPFAVHVAIHQPAIATAIAQSNAANAPASQSSEAHPAAPETLKLLTPDGEEVTLTVVHRPKVGDVVRAGGHRMKIVSIDPQGQYKVYVLKNTTDYASMGEPGPQEKIDAYATKKARMEAELQERAERAVQETIDGELSEQEAQARREAERVERATRAQRQAELARKAKVTMDQAIQIVLRTTPGTVVEARLAGERDSVTYLILVLTQNGVESKTTRLMINAVDGNIMATDEWGQER